MKSNPALVQTGVRLLTSSIATFGPWSFMHFWIIFFPIPAVHDLPSLPECCISPPSNQYFCLKASGWSCIQPSPLYLAGISQCSLLDFSCKPLQPETGIISVMRHTNLSETNWVSLWGYNIKLQISPPSPHKWLFCYKSIHLSLACSIFCSQATAIHFIQPLSYL